MNNNWVGKNLGKVQIEAPIARGGAAEVYLGTHTTLHRKVAVKILRSPGEEHSDALERFQREARVVANLRHPNIVQVYDFDMVDHDPYLVMEYIQGPSLSKYLYFLHQSSQRLELPQIARIIRGVASALQYAHYNGVIHRDIKPGNILLISPTKDIETGQPLPDDFEPVLTDFGLVRFMDSSRQTATGVAAGTPAYMSPEQAQGETTDGRTDIYSLGVVLYEMLSGKLPFEGETTMSILLKHVTEPPQPIPGITPHMQKVLDRALAKHAVDRYQTPMEFANAFGAAVDIQPGTMQVDSLADIEPSTIEFKSALTKISNNKPNEPAKPRSSNWKRFALIGGILIAMSAFLIFSGLPFTETETPTATSPIPSRTATATETATSTGTSTLTLVPILLEPSVILRFQDGNAIADQVVVDAKSVPAPPAGNRYEVWIINVSNNKKRISLGILDLDEQGMGILTYTDEQGTNLAALYNQAEITIEPEDDIYLSPTNWIAYSYTLPAEGLVNVRYLLASYKDAPNKIALIQGLHTSIEKVNELTLGMQTAFGAGDEIQLRKNAEAILNLIAGKQSADYKDWDQDGSITDENDGFGLFLNGSSPGYLQAVYTEANNTVRSGEASEPMRMYGEDLKTSVQNLAQWTQQTQELTLSIFDSPDQQKISELVDLTEKMLDGTDLDNNTTIDPVPGESGANFAYRYAYSMADMPLVNVGIQYSGTGTPVFVAPSSSSGGGGGGGGVVTDPTKKPPPGQEKKTPKP